MVSILFWKFRKEKQCLDKGKEYLCAGQLDGLYSLRMCEDLPPAGSLDDI